MSLDEAIHSYESAAHVRFQGLPDDWSFHHVVFSRPRPDSPEEYQVQNDPRYWFQQIRHAAARTFGGLKPADFRPAVQLRSKAKRDWSQCLGSSATAGALNFPAKYSLTVDGTPGCTDFVVYNTSLAGSSSQASIIAYNNLYKSPVCTGTVPQTFWAYNTGGTVSNSPVLSADGTKVAFIQSSSSGIASLSSSSGIASLVVLKWPTGGGGTGRSPITLSSNSSFPSCTAPCMISIPFANGSNDLNSSPFYDYSGSDTLFVGGSDGGLHQFNSVFTGTPSEVTTGGYPIAVSQDNEPLSSPAYDSGLGLVFVGDLHGSGASNDGEVHSVNVSTGAVANSAQLCVGSGYEGGPVLDPAAGELYFACANDSGAGPSCNSSQACLRQFTETSISGSIGIAQSIGSDSSNEAVGPGAFDNIYLTSTNGSSPSGNFYICGNPGGLATLYRIPITSNSIGTSVAIATLSSTSIAGPDCSPVTEFFNSSTTTDWLFVSPTGKGSQSSCTSSGCVYSFNATTALAAGATASSGLASANGASGIVVDNIGASSSTVANIYYSTLSNQSCTGGTGGCAVQASQGTLQ
jgi:hypothetical protein